MLAPGDFLTTPTPKESYHQPAVRRVETPRVPEPQPTAPAPKVKEPERRSFLQILLSALGAIHT
jgi:hypothetical protein